MRVEGAVALVTGAGRGLGRAFARELVRRGAATVYGAARDPGAVTESGVSPVALDITDPVRVAQAARQCADVSLLVNNAGAAARRPRCGAGHGVSNSGAGCTRERQEQPDSARIQRASRVIASSRKERLNLQVSERLPGLAVQDRREREGRIAMIHPHWVTRQFTSGGNAGFGGHRGPDRASGTGQCRVRVREQARRGAGFASGPSA